MAGLLISSLALQGAVKKPYLEPEDVAKLKGRELQYSMEPSETLTGCTVIRGDELPVTTADDPEPVNEPCYIHDGGVCDGYQVCCVTINTCQGMGGTVSSNEWYYKGGCVSSLSSAGMSEQEARGCAKQGECHGEYLTHHMGSTTFDATLKTELDVCVEADLMQDSEGCDFESECVASDGSSNKADDDDAGLEPWVWAVIGVGGLVAIGGIGFFGMKMMKPKAAAPGKAGSA
jgi:hypothetical protein